MTDEYGYTKTERAILRELACMPGSCDYEQVEDACPDLDWGDVDDALRSLSSEGDIVELCDSRGRKRYILAP